MRNGLLSLWWLSLVAIVSMGMAGCGQSPATRAVVADSVGTAPGDSAMAYPIRHYAENYNFVVTADSLALLRQMPEEAVSNLPIDSFYVYRDDMLVVADFRILQADRIDSVWVQLACLKGDMGWIHEGWMLQNVVPDNPISQFISFFSNRHLLIFLGVFVVILCAYGMRRLMRMNAHIVHFRDIATFYPTLLTVTVAVSATFYASIQMFAPDKWQAFYFQPSLNPFSQPLLIGMFLTSVWIIVVVAIAAVDDTLRHLSVGEAVPYLLGVAGVCAVNYMVFSLSTLYYVGFPLLVAYVAFAIYRYLYHTRSKYVCGHCGQQIKRKGRCPHCGTVNE